MNQKIINFIVFDKYEKIKGIYEELKKIDEISVEYYEDIYEKDVTSLRLIVQKPLKQMELSY